MGLFDDKRGKHSRELGFYFDTGLQFGLSIIFGFLGGWWLDTKAGTLPLFLLTGIFFGAIAGFYNLYRQVTAHNRRKDSDET